MIFQANAQISPFGNITWAVGSNTRPNGAVVYLHAGGPTGVITTSAFATILNVDQVNGDEDRQANLNAVPTNPPQGGMSGSDVTYTLEVDALLKGIVCSNPSPDGSSTPVVANRTLLVRGG